jgi:aspartate racemase
MISVDFAVVERMQERRAWDEPAAIWPSARAGSNRRCTNTMHRVYGDLCQAVSIPVLHIADGTARQLKAAQVTTVGLLGTRYTMEQDFAGNIADVGRTLRGVPPHVRGRCRCNGRYRG